MGSPIERLLSVLTYKDGWRFKVGGPKGRFLCVHAHTDNSTGPGTRWTQHMFEIPPLDGVELGRWVFARLLDAERHEAAEFYRVDGAAPFFPHHQDEGSPYEHVEREITWP